MGKKNYPYYKVEPFRDFKDMISQRVKAHPDHTAFMFTENKQDISVSYKEFQEQINSLGTAIAGLGVHGKKIAMVSENSYYWILVYLTVLGSDNVYIPVDKELPQADLLNVLNHSDTQIIFCSSAFAAKLCECRSQLPNVDHIFCFNTKGELPQGIEDAKEFMAKGKAMLEGGDVSYTSQEPEDMELGEIVYTSGTTGAPKGVMLSRHNLVSSVYYGMMVSKVYTKCLAVLPFNHTYEGVCDLLVSLHNGNTICINENLRTVQPNLEKYKPDYIMLVPLFVETFYKKIMKNIEKQGKTKTVNTAIKLSNFLRKIGIDKRRSLFKEIHAAFGGNLIKIVCGGAPNKPEIAAFFDAIGIDLINGYGITECSPLVCANRDYYNVPRSVGPKLPCIDIEIRDPNEEGEGEIFVKGDIVMMGYYKDPVQTAEVLSEDGWFATGDYGKMVGDLLYITGRKKYLIVLTNGKNVYPEEIEEYIQRIAGVEEVVVYALKNQEGDETGLCAEIYPEAAFAEGKTNEEMEAYFEKCADEALAPLPAYKHLKSVVIRGEEFPKTTSRKIKRAGIGTYK